MSTQEIGRRGELAVMRWLTERGCDVERKRKMLHRADLYIFRAERFTETTNLHFILPRPLVQPYYHLHYSSIQRWRDTFQNFETEY